MHRGSPPNPGCPSQHRGLHARHPCHPATPSSQPTALPCRFSSPLCDMVARQKSPSPAAAGLSGGHPGGIYERRRRRRPLSSAASRRGAEGQGAGRGRTHAAAAAPIGWEAGPTGGGGTRGACGTCGACAGWSLVGAEAGPKAAGSGGRRFLSP